MPGKGDRHVGDLATLRSLSEPVAFPLHPLAREHLTLYENTEKTTAVPFGTGTCAFGYRASPHSSRDPAKHIRYEREALLN